MNNQDKAEIKRAKNILIASNNPALNYQFIKEDKDIDDFAKLPMIIMQNQYDYSIKKDEGTDDNLPSLVPLSLINCGNNLEDVESWYAAKYPELPADYHGIMARYSTKQLMTKKETKNAIKKMKKKPNREEPVGLSIARGPIIVEFD